MGKAVDGILKLEGVALLGLRVVAGLVSRICQYGKPTMYMSSR